MVHIYTSSLWSYPYGHHRPLSTTATAPFSYEMTTTTWSLSLNFVNSELWACPWAKTLTGLLPAIHDTMSRSWIVESLNIPPVVSRKYQSRQCKIFQSTNIYDILVVLFFIIDYYMINKKKINNKKQTELYFGYHK